MRRDKKEEEEGNDFSVLLDCVLWYECNQNDSN